MRDGIALLRDSGTEVRFAGRLASMLVVCVSILELHQRAKVCRLSGIAMGSVNGNIGLHCLARETIDNV